MLGNDDLVRITWIEMCIHHSHKHPTMCWENFFNEIIHKCRFHYESLRTPNMLLFKMKTKCKRKWYILLNVLSTIRLFYDKFKALLCILPICWWQWQSIAQLLVVYFNSRKYFFLSAMRGVCNMQGRELLSVPSFSLTERRMQSKSMRDARKCTNSELRLPFKQISRHWNTSYRRMLAYHYARAYYMEAYL